MSYALTATTNVPAVYLQQFWKTISEVPNTKDTIKFKLDSQEITYTIDMFLDTLQLLKVGYQGVVDKVSSFYTKFLVQPWQTMFKKKDVITYPCFRKLIIADLLKKCPSISKRLEEDYHSIKDDISLVSVYSTGNGLFQGMPISDAFLTDEIRATDDYVEYKTVFVKVSILINQPQPVVSSQGTHRTTPRAYKTPTLTAASPQGKKRKQIAEETSSARKSLKVTIKQKVNTTSIPPPSDDRERDEIAEATLLSLTLYKTTLAAEALENVAKVQEKLVEEEIEKMVEIEEDDESYVSEFADSMLNDDDADFGTRIEPESHKENPKVVDVDDKDDKKDEDDKKADDAAGKKDNDDQTNHSSVETHATGSMETRNEHMQTPTPTPTRSPQERLIFI
ncbi:hypothetical protein Tco_1541882 [Tanacetum coccineum]